MPSVFELPFHSHNVLLVLWIGIIQLPQNLRFFSSGNIPDY